MGHLGRGASSSCECGLSYCTDSPDDLRAHDLHHDLYLNGHPFPPCDRVVGVVSGAPLVDARPGDPSSRRRPFAKLAMVAQHETPQFKAGYYGSKDEDTVGRRAFAVVEGGRAVALLIAQLDTRAWPGMWRNDGLYLTSPEADTSERSVIQRVWVAKSRRREGMAQAMVREVARVLGEDLSGLAWEGPFTEAGASLLRTLRPSALWIAVGDIADLRRMVVGVLE